MQHPAIFLGLVVLLICSPIVVLCAQIVVDSDSNGVDPSHIVTKQTRSNRMVSQIVILGASGDLTARKLIPALFAAQIQNQFNDSVQVVGVARRPWDDAGFRAHLTELSPAASNGQFAEFLSNSVFYVKTNLDKEQDYVDLKGRLDSMAPAPNRVFYLAVPPSLFLESVRGLKSAGLLDEVEDGNQISQSSRVVVEKPFGTDLQSARMLNYELLKILKERQLYRIDHYLGKETVQNILAFRFRNAMFEPLWNQKHVELIQITVAETVGMEAGRGGYYDTAGAMRDIVQNHVLQLVSLVCMEPPASLSADDVRNEKVKVIKSLRLKDEDLDKHICRAQFEGYLQERGVNPASETETYIAVRTYIDSWRWGGVPILVRTGKHLPSRFTSITVQFKMPPHSLFGSYDECHLRPNNLTLRIQPKEGIDLGFDVKQPGSGQTMTPARMTFNYDDVFKGETPEAYQRLLLDVVKGDQTLFVRSDEVEMAWIWADKLRAQMAATPVHIYPKATWGPAAANSLFGECEGRWVKQ